MKIKNSFITFVITFIIFGNFYAYHFQKARVFTQTPSKFGGYESDGNYSYCEELNNSLKQYCRDTKTPPFVLAFPNLSILMSFVIMPSLVTLLMFKLDND